jgi:hypothetical protein
MPRCHANTAGSDRDPSSQIGAAAHDSSKFGLSS